jgi:succinoglycan biosynthesis transport protein ExoP
MYIETTSRGILTALFRQKIKLFLTVALITLVGLAYIFSLTPRYETKGSLLVKFGEGAVPSIARPDSQRSTEFSRSDRSELMQSYLKILQSHARRYWG